MVRLPARFPDSSGDCSAEIRSRARRKEPLAKEYAAKTAEDPNPKYRLASAWISALDR